MKRHFTLFFFCTLVTCFSQSQVIVLKGKVFVESDSIIDYSYLRVDNLTTQDKTFCDSLGYFSLEVALNDSILVSSPFIKDRKLKVNNRVFAKEELSIYTKEEFIELEEVIIAPFVTTGYLDLDVKKNQEKIDSAMAFDDQLNLWVQQWGGNPDAIRLEDFNSKTYWDRYPLNKDLEKIKSSLIMRKKNGQVIEIIKGAVAAEEYVKNQTYIQATIDYFGNAFFIEEYNLKEKEIFMFVEFCFFKNANMKQWFNELNFLEILQTFDQYKNTFLERLSENETE